MSKNKNLPAIIVMFALFFMIAFVTNFAGSMGVIVTKQFGATKALSQLGTLANFIAYACMGIPAGIILKRKGYKFTALAAVIVGLVGVAVQWISGPAESFLVYVIGAFIAGFSMCMLNIVVNPMLNTLGGGGNEGNRLIQLGGSCNSVGGTIAPILLGYLVGGTVENATVRDAAPAMIIAMAIFALAFVIIFFSAIPEPELEAAKAAPAKESEGVVASVKGALSHNNLLFGIIAIFVYVGVEVGIPNIANLYMTSGAEHGGLGIATGTAGTIVGLYWLLMLCGRLVGGALGGKISSKHMMTGVSSVAILLVILGIFIPESAVISLGALADGAVVPVKILCFVLCGLCTSVMWGSIFNLAVEGLGKYTSIASGVFMVMVCGGGILPYFQGLLADVTSFVSSYWLIVVALGYMLCYTLFLSKPSPEEE